MDTPHSTFRVSEPFAQLSRKLSAARWYWHALRAAESLLGFAALAAGSLLLLFAADALLKPSPAARLALMGVTAVVLLVAFFYFLICALRRVSDMDVAARVEAKNPHLDERLLAALELQRGQFDPRGLSNALVQATIYEGTDAALRVDFRKAFDTTRVKRRGGAALATCGTLAALAVLAPAALGDSFRRYQSAYPEWLWERYGNVTVSPGNCVVLKGSDVDIKAEVKGGKAKEIHVEVTPQRTPELVRGTQPRSPQQVEASRHRMQRGDEPNQFHYALFDLKQSLTYRVIADNHVSPEYKVEVVDAPMVTNLQMEYRYPDYTGWSPQYVENSDGNIKALRGTQVTLVATTNRAVKEAQIVFDPNPKSQIPNLKSPIPLTISDGKTLRADLTLKQAGSYTIHLRDQYGFEDVRRKTYEIQVLPDKSPTVSVISPKNICALPEALIPVVTRAADDFGVGKLSVNWSISQLVNSKSAIRNPQSAIYDPPNPTPAETFALNLKQMKAKPGDVITYFAQVYDNDTVDGPKSAKSQVYKIKVLSVADFLEELKKYQREMGKVLNHLFNKQLGLLHKNQQFLKQLQSGEQVSNDSLGQLSQEQRDLALLAQQLAQDIKQMQEQAHLSNLATPFENVEQRLESIAKDLMKQAAQNLSRAQQQKGGQQQKGNMQKAEQQQKDAADALDTLKEGLENLDKEKQLLEMVQKAMAMRTEQETISQNLQNASPQQMQQQANKQQSLSKQAQQLAKQAQEAAKEYQKEDPITSQRLEDVPNLMERQQLQQSMKQSSQAMQNQNAQQARENSQKAAESLKDLEEYLKRAYQDAQLNRARKERDYLGKMLFQVEKLIREQSQVIEGTKKLSEGMKDTTRTPEHPNTPPPPPNFGNPPRQNDPRRNLTPEHPNTRIPEHPNTPQALAQQQGSIAEQTEGLTDDLRWLMKAIPQLKLSSPSVARDAAQPMKEAMGKLQKNQPKEALPKEQQGKSELEKIAQALRDAFAQQQGGGSQTMGEGQQQALNLAALQEGINDRTKQLHQKQQRGRLSPSEKLELDQMARQEEFIRQAVTQARNMFGGAWSPDTRSIIDQARKDLRDVEAALPQQQTGKETQDKQHDILAALLRIGNEMSGQQQGGGEQQQEGMPVTFGGMQPMQPQPAQSQPNSMDGRLTEHGPAMKFIPETLKANRGLAPGSDAALRQPSAVNKPTKRGVEGRALPQYEKATGDYFKKIGK